MKANTGHKDFCGEPLFEGDLVAVLEKGKYSSRLLEAVVVGATPKSVRVRMDFSGKEPVFTVRSPHNVAKLYKNN